MQSVFRIYRFGQQKDTFVYRFISAETMEECIANRQVNKTKQAMLVMDEVQTKRTFDLSEIKWFYNDSFDSEPFTSSHSCNELPLVDDIIKNVIRMHSPLIRKIENRNEVFKNNEEDLTPDDQRKAWEDFKSDETKFIEQDKKRIKNMLR